MTQTRRMEVSALYPDCDFSIWFRSVNEDSTTVTPIQGRKTGIPIDMISEACMSNTRFY